MVTFGRTRAFSPLRTTVYDLHLERERLPWYYRMLAVVSSWLALGGYILFSLLFTSNIDNLKTSRRALTGIASTLLLVGYAGISCTAVLSKSILFIFDCVLLPILTASFMGLVVTVLNHALHKTFPITTDAYIYIPLVTSSVTTVSSGVLSFLVFRRLTHVKSTDNRQRISSVTHYQYGDTPAGAELLPMPMQMPEDEAQRQQLLRLLISRESGRGPSPDRESTYHIDLPSPLAVNERRTSSGAYLAVPSSEPGRARSDSAPMPGQAQSKSRWLDNLHFMPGRNRSPTVDSESFKDPRVRRREEIERSGSTESTPRAGYDSWPSPAPYSPIPAPAWGSARYA